MSQQPSFVIFEAPLPDDSQFSDSGEIVIPAGQALSRILTRALEDQGFEVQVWDQYQFYGWHTVIKQNGHRLWLLIQGLQDWLLIIERKKGIIDRIHGGAVTHHELLMAIDAAIKGDKHIKEVSWLTREEYERGDRIGRLTP